MHTELLLYQKLSLHAVVDFGAINSLNSVFVKSRILRDMHISHYRWKPAEQPTNLITTTISLLLIAVRIVKKGTPPKSL